MSRFFGDSGAREIELTGISTGDNLDAIFDSVAQFRATSGIPTETTSVTIRGYYGQGTPGGGVFFLDRTDTSTADNGILTLINSDGLRAKRSIDGDEIRASWIGMVTDGVTDNSAKKNTLFELALLLNKGVWFDQSGTYYFASNDVATNAHISHGQTFSVRGGPGVKIKTANASSHFIDFNTNSISSVLTANLEKGGRSISINDATIKNGDILHLRLVNAANNSQIAWEQLFAVTLDSANNIYIEASKFFFPSADPYTLPDGVTEVKTTVTVYKKTPNFAIKDFEFAFDLVSDNSGANFRRAIEMHGGNVHLENLSLTTDRDATTNEKNGFFNLPSIINWRHGRMTAKNIRAKNSGYTLWLQWCQSAVIEGIYGENVRHFVTQNNCHNVVVKDAYVYNGGAIDAHGCWDFKGLNINASNPPGVDLDNIRGMGNTEILGSNFQCSELKLSGPVSTYTWDDYAETLSNLQLFKDNMLSTLTVKDTTISGILIGGTYKFRQSYSGVTCSGIDPGELVLGSLVNVGSVLELDNVKYHSGNLVLFPAVGTGNARNISVVNKSNPQNEIPSWFVGSANSASGNDTYIGLVDCYTTNPQIRHNWKFGEALYKRIYGRQDTDPNSITIVLIVRWSGFPHVSRGDNRTIQLKATGRLIHNNGGNSTNLICDDEANLLYTNSGASLVNNFSQTRGSSNYQPLSITATRSTQGNVGGGPNEPLPTEISDYTGLHRIELDIDIDVRQTNGSIAFGITGVTQHHPIT